MRLALDRQALARPDWPQLGIRFAFGAGIALAAGLIGMRFGPRVGGAFLAFPAILPAALTLLERADGVEKTDVDAVGAILGAVAMALFAAGVVLLARRTGPVAAIVAAATVWLLAACALYALTKRILLRPTG